MPSSFQFSRHTAPAPAARDQVEFRLPLKMFGDPPFRITLPHRPGAGALCFSSSDPKVARIEDGVVTLTGPGMTDITIRRAGSAIIRGAKFVAQLCVGPHPALLLQGGLMWFAPHAQRKTCAEAVLECAKLFDGSGGWRLPTTGELKSFFASRPFSLAIWPGGDYWCSSDGSGQLPCLVNAQGGAVSMPIDAGERAHVAYVRASPQTGLGAALRGGQ